MREIEIEGASLETLRALDANDQDALLAFGQTLSFRMGSANILAEFNRDGSLLIVNLAHIDGGGEGVLVRLWKLLQSYGEDRDYEAIRWNVHAATCAEPNPRLQRFLRMRGFLEVDDARYGRIFTFTQTIAS